MYNFKKMVMMLSMTVITVMCISCGEKEDNNTGIYRNNTNIVSGTVTIPTTSVNKRTESSTTKSISTTSAATKTANISETMQLTSVGATESDNSATVITTEPISSTPIFWQEGYQYYIVQPGDSWYRIANILDVDPIQLAYANGCTLEYVLQAGEKLFIPNANIDYTQQYVDAQSNQQNSGQIIGSGVVSDSCDSESWKNIVKALDDINGLTLAPGEFFYWNERLGWKTAMEVDPYTGVNPYGYVEAPVIGNYNAPGGGICVVTTLFNKTVRNCSMGGIHSKAHSESVNYASGTDEATVNYGGTDFYFYNSKPYNVVFYTYYNYPTVSMVCQVA